MQSITLDEMEEALTASSKNKAPGPLKIHTEFWTNGSHIGKEFLNQLMNACLIKCDIPSDWKKAAIILIPKPKEWGGDIRNTRPIALIESTRKIFTRILTSRISQACQKYDILQGDNFSVLNNTSTSTPIHIINAVLEHAKAHNKQAWLVLQDIKKAYDSVGWKQLEKSLQRIHMNEQFITLLKRIHQSRYTNINTEFGLTDGLDQGEIWSPILWRIFYDPLLAEIKHREKILGYNMTTQWRPNI